MTKIQHKRRMTFGVIMLLVGVALWTLFLENEHVDLNSENERKEHVVKEHAKKEDQSDFQVHQRVLKNKRIEEKVLKQHIPEDRANLADQVQPRKQKYLRKIAETQRLSHDKQHGVYEAVYHTPDFKYAYIREREEWKNGQLIRRQAMVADHLMVKLQEDTWTEELSATLADQGIHLRERLGRSQIYLLSFNGLDLNKMKEVSEILKTFEAVTLQEPDYIVHAIGIPDDTSFGQLWGMHNNGQSGGTADADIDASEAWEIETGSADILVGVIDSGVDYTHPDLANNIWTNLGEIAGNGIDDDNNGYVDDVHGYDFYDNDGDPMDPNGHGTHCAGTIGAEGNNSTGVVGVCWDVSIVCLRFLGADGSGTTSGAINAVVYAHDMELDLTSNSWGGGGSSSILRSVIQDLQNDDQIFIAAAGNDTLNNDDSPHYPSSYDLENVVSVAASDRNDNRSTFSNYGIESVDLAAPGTAIYSTIPGNGYANSNGTSMATPHVAGVAALLKSYKPSASYAQIRDALLDTVDELSSFDGFVTTGGRLNAYKALQYFIPKPGAYVIALREDGAVGQVGNSDGVFNPGETVSLDIEFSNLGIEELVNGSVECLLKNVEPHISIGSPSLVSIGNISENGQASASFLVTADAAVTAPKAIEMQIVIRADNISDVTYDFIIQVNQSALLSGIVRKKTGADPIADAIIRINGQESISAIDGSFSLIEATGIYTIQVSAAGYTSQVFENINLPYAGTFVVEMGAPDLQISPNSFSETVTTTDILERSILIENDGDEQLDVTLDIKLGELKCLYYTTVISDDASDDFTTALMNQSFISELDVRSGLTWTPTLAEMLEYDCIIVSSNGAFDNNQLLGDRLADYIDHGGALVLMLGSIISSGDWALAGRITEDAYLPFNQAIAQNLSLELDRTDGSRYVDGVSVLETDYIINQKVLNVNSQAIAYFDDDYIAAALHVEKPILMLNFFPLNNLWSGDWPVVIENTIVDFLSPRLELSQTVISLDSLVKQDVDLTITKGRAARGRYELLVSVSHNDPNEINPYNVDLVVEVEGNASPSITLNGDSTVYVNYTDNYIEQGATATDREDGDLTDQIQLMGSVGTELGTYILTYSVTDSEANTATIQRTVIVREAEAGALGYYILRNNTSPQETYAWQDISETGLLLSAAHQDDSYTVLTLSEDYPYFGEFTRALSVASNGFLQLNYIDPSGSAALQALPSLSAPSGIIAPFWVDLNPQTQGSIYFQEFDDYFIVQWNDCQYYSLVSSFTFQVRMYQDGRIYFYYELLNAYVADEIVGIQNKEADLGYSVYDGSNLANSLTNYSGIGFYPVGELVDRDVMANRIDENSGANQQTGVQAFVHFNGNPTVAYSLIDDAEGKFIIDSESGLITSTQSFDYEQQASYVVKVRADGGSYGVEGEFTISIVNIVQEAPVLENVYFTIYGRLPDGAISIQIDEIDAVISEDEFFVNIPIELNNQEIPVQVHFESAIQNYRIQVTEFIASDLIAQ